MEKQKTEEAKPVIEDKVEKIDYKQLLDQNIKSKTRHKEC